MSNYKNDDSFAEIVIPGGEKKADGFAIPPAGTSRYAGKGAYPSQAKKKAEEVLCFEYDPGLTFIKRVKVYTWGAKRSFYERFREDALRYRDMKGTPCQAIPFFSYIPQYSQMNLYQSNYYLYFRDRARAGEYIPADLSYILLYIYEIINLSDESVPADDINILCGLWMAYRDTYPALDKYMAEWVCDYCLLYRLPVPDCTREILPKLCEAATLREFFMSGTVAAGQKMQGEVFEAFADYDRRRSRVELPEELCLHFPKALEAAVSVFDSEHFISGEIAVLSRDAFCGSLCAHNVKRKLVVEYYPALRRSGVRHMLGAAVKYTENKIRRAAGMKSRLHTDGLPDLAKAKIDEYFEIAMPEIFRGKTHRAEPIPEYERYYDAADIPFSADAAERIERESRAAAEMLAALEFDEPAADDAIPETPVDTGVTEDSATTESSVEPIARASSANVVPAAIRHMLEGGDLDGWCRERGLLPDSIAGEINEAAVEAFGDVLLENDGSGWRVIDDYLVEAAEMAVAEE